MKTIILYATKYGAAAEIARRISAHIDGAVVHDLKQPAPDITEYDCVIIGTSVYAGMFRKEAKAFLSQNADFLCKKKLGLFASGLTPSEEQQIFTNNVPKKVLKSAKAAVFLGGIFDPKKAGFAERLIMKVAAKQSKYTDTIDYGKIEQFVKTVRT